MQNADPNATHNTHWDGWFWTFVARTKSAPCNMPSITPAKNAALRSTGGSPCKATSGVQQTQDVSERMEVAVDGSVGGGVAVAAMASHRAFAIVCDACKRNSRHWADAHGRAQYQFMLLCVMNLLVKGSLSVIMYACAPSAVQHAWPISWKSINANKQHAAESATDPLTRGNRSPPASCATSLCSSPMHRQSCQTAISTPWNG